MKCFECRLNRIYKWVGDIYVCVCVCVCVCVYKIIIGVEKLFKVMGLNEIT